MGTYIVRVCMESSFALHSNTGLGRACYSSRPALPPNILAERLIRNELEYRSGGASIMP